MKRLFSVLLVFGLGALLVAGCGGEQVTSTTTTTSATTTTVPDEMSEADLAIYFAALSNSAADLDDKLPTLIELDLSSGLLHKDADDWWRLSDRPIVYGISDYAVKMWIPDNNLVEDEFEVELFTTPGYKEKIHMVVTVVGSSGTLGPYQFGIDTSKPLIVVYGSLVHGTPDTATGYIRATEPWEIDGEILLVSTTEVNFSDFSVDYPTGITTTEYIYKGTAIATVSAIHDGDGTVTVGPFSDSGNRYSVNLGTDPPTVTPLQ